MKKINKEDILFKVFWKTKDEVIIKDNGMSELKVILTPRFGKIGVIIWYCLSDDCKFVVENE